MAHPLLQSQIETEKLLTICVWLGVYARLIKFIPWEYELQEAFGISMIMAALLGIVIMSTHLSNHIGRCLQSQKLFDLKAFLLIWTPIGIRL